MQQINNTLLGSNLNILGGGISKKSGSRKKRVKIGSFNVTGVNGKNAVRTLKYIKNMLKQDVDILALQEVSTSNTKRYHANLDATFLKHGLTFKWESVTEFPKKSGKKGKSYQVFYNTKTIAGISHVAHMEFSKPAVVCSVSGSGRVRKSVNAFQPDSLESERPPVKMEVKMLDSTSFDLVTWHAPTGNVKTGLSGESYVMGVLAHKDIVKTYYADEPNSTFLAMDANAVRCDLDSIYGSRFPQTRHQHLDMVGVSEGWSVVDVIDETVLGKSPSNGHNGLIVEFEEK